MEGDHGGNFEHVPDPTGSGVENLHSIWDSVIYEYGGYETLPLTESRWDWYTEQINNIVKGYPIDQSKLALRDYEAWAEEDLDIAINYVYKGFTAGEAPSDEYLATASQVIKTRIMYGGWRLADLIKDIYEEK